MKLKTYLPIHPCGRPAPRGCSFAFARTFRLTLQCWAAHKNVAGLRRSGSAAEQFDQVIAGPSTAGPRAGVTALARPVDLSCRNARQPDLRTLGAPYRSVPIPTRVGVQGKFVPEATMARTVRITTLVVPVEPVSPIRDYGTTELRHFEDAT